MNIFHHAIKVKDLKSTRKFYMDILGCEEGRSTESWIDFNFFGHQLSAHVSSDLPELDFCGDVDGISVPIPHFGCVLDINDFNRIKTTLEEHNATFLIPAQKRYADQVGEQLTLFVYDFSGNPIEFKCYANADELFST